MTGKRIKGDVTFICDQADCFAMHTAPTGNFQIGWRLAKSAGWVTATIDGKWLHFCSWVHRPQTDEQLRRLVARPDLNPREVKHQ